MKPLDLNHLYFDGRHYDLQNGDYEDDIPFYVKMAETYGEPVLELACGTGRIAIPLARKGWQITGLDPTESMLTEAKRKAVSADVTIEWFQGDCRDFALGKKFNMIFFPFNSIAVLHDLEDISGCFNCVRKHLKKHGRFIIDIFNPRFDILTRNPDERFPVTEYPDPAGNGQVVVTESNVYDCATQISHIKWYYKFGDAPEEIIEDLNLRIFFPQELDALLQFHGLEIDAKYGDFDETPFVSDSQKQLVVCRKR